MRDEGIHRKNFGKSNKLIPRKIKKKKNKKQKERF